MSDDVQRQSAIASAILLINDVADNAVQVDSNVELMFSPETMFCNERRVIGRKITITIVCDK